MTVRRPQDAGGDDGLSVELIARICAACVRSVPVTGAAVSVMTPGGHRGTVYASDAVVSLVEDLHFGLGEGPGVDAFRDREPILVGDLADADGVASARWPAFTSAALKAGVHAVFVFPLLIGAAELGVLVLYREVAGGLDGPQRARAVRLADAATFAMLDLHGGVSAFRPDDADDDRWGMDGAFFRAEVYQAAGMVMVQLGVSIEDALARVRGYAFADGRSVLEVARDIVRHDLRLESDND